MGLNSIKTKITHPVIVAIAAGMYPVLFYYSNNFSLINSWKHLGFFIVMFLISPIIIFTVANRIAKHIFFNKWRSYILPFLNIFTFLFFLELCLYARIQIGITIGITIIALLVTIFLSRHYKKIIVFQFLLAIIGVFTLVPTISKQLNYSKEWMIQPDDIEKAVFKKRPNVYFIQPDGYVNFSEIDKGYYEIDNNAFKQYLEQNDFKIYDNIRSNYNSTLVSNTSIFMMKHHYLNSGFNFTETIDGREIIISKNTVLDIFKKNNYKTHFLAEWSYLLTNYPNMGYDECNIDYGDISYLNTGFTEEQELLTPLKKYIEEDVERSKFFFIEIFKPGHVPPLKVETKGAKIEREIWIKDLKIANKKLRDVIDIIKEGDPNALVIIMADHGGYVGMDYMMQMRIKTDDRNILYSIFSVNLAIKWPDNEAPKTDKNFRSSVNVFRILFSYLTENEEYLNHLQEDVSFLIINKEAPKGIYKCIDENGNVIFKKYNGN